MPRAVSGPDRPDATGLAWLALGGEGRAPPHLSKGATDRT